MEDKESMDDLAGALHGMGELQRLSLATDGKMVNFTAALID